MTYLQQYNSYRESIKKKSYSKLFWDMVSILDHELFQIDEDLKAGKFVKQREKAWRILCQLVQKINIPEPSWEKSFASVYLGNKHIQFISTSEKEDYEEMWASLLTKNLLSDSNGHIDGLLTVIKLFLPMFFSDDETISKKTLLAALNLELTNHSKSPVFLEKFNFSKICKNYSNEGPFDQKRVLIIDDQKSDLLETAMFLAGWENLKLEFYWQQEKEEVEDPYQGILEDLERSFKSKGGPPHIVLMDQDLDECFGSKLMPVLKAKYPNIIFVANTKGGANPLEKEGCLKNLSKNENSEGVKQAIKMLKAK